MPPWSEAVGAPAKAVDVFDLCPRPPRGRPGRGKAGESGGPAGVHLDSFGTGPRGAWRRPGYTAGAQPVLPTEVEEPIVCPALCSHRGLSTCEMLGFLGFPRARTGVQRSPEAWHPQPAGEARVSHGLVLGMVLEPELVTERLAPLGLSPDHQGTHAL